MDAIVLALVVALMFYRAFIQPRLSKLGRSGSQKQLVRHRQASLRGPSRRQVVLAASRERRGENPILPLSYVRAREILRHQPKMAVSSLVETFSVEEEVDSASRRVRKIAEKFASVSSPWAGRVEGRGHRRGGNLRRGLRDRLLSRLSSWEGVVETSPAKKPATKTSLRVVRAQEENERLWHLRQSRAARRRAVRSQVREEGVMNVLLPGWSEGMTWEDVLSQAFPEVAETWESVMGSLLKEVA